jgi:hypothetical protein
MRLIDTEVLYVPLSLVSESHHGYRVATVLCEVRTEGEETVAIEHIIQHSTTRRQHCNEWN